MGGLGCRNDASLIPWPGFFPPVTEIAAGLRVGVRQVERWRNSREGGMDALCSKGPVSVERLSPEQWDRVEQALGRGPLVHGWTEGGGWSLARIATVIGRMFHIGYTVQGVWTLLRRHGWSAQVPAHRAIERDDTAVEVWKTAVRPKANRPRRAWAPVLCFEDEAGQALRPPKGRSWAPRGQTAVVRVRAGGRGAVCQARRASARGLPASPVAGPRR